MQSVETMLDQLARIAISVRQSGRRSRLQRADHLFKPEEHEDFRRHLITITLARAEFSQEQIGPSNLNEIQQRLIYCNLKRRNRFLYAQQHSIRLKPSVTAPSIDVRFIEESSQPGVTEKTDLSLEKEHKSISSPSTSKTSSKAPTASINSTIRTGTDASAISDSFNLSRDPLPATAVSTVVSSTMVNLKYPRPPKVKHGARVFTCPCCCQIFPVAVLEGNKWKKHIAEDLCPYSCILPKCNNPTALFITAQSWRQHLLKEHNHFTYWICFSCQGHIQLETEEAFITHVQKNHAATMPPHQIPLLANISKRSVPVEISSCPLCDWPEKDGEGVPIDKDMLLDHIAKDLHSFSLRSLPWADDNGQETHERISYSSDKVYHWLVKNDLCQSLTQERPSLEAKFYNSRHFQHNPYFAISSASSSSSTSESLASWEEELEKWKQEDPIAFEKRDGSPVEKGDEDLADIGFEEEATNKESGQMDIENLTNNRQPELTTTAETWDAAMFELLLRDGNKIQPEDVYNQIPLIWATQEGNEPLAKLVLEKGADIEAKNKMGWTSLILAVCFREEAIVKLLLERGANIEAQDSEGRTPLFWAAYYGEEAIVKLLLESGANIEARDSEGRTPLSWAAREGYKAIVKLLIGTGKVHIKQEDNHSQTPVS
ncbi:hypothetical protein V8C37DRAFT_378458 [Trichoderma ceciliae]